MGGRFGARLFRPCSMYNDISANKRKTWILLTLFSFFIILLFGVIGIAADIDPLGTMFLGFLFSIIYCLFSYYASSSITLMSAGAKELQKQDAFEIYTMVENLCITAGLPMPKIYLIQDSSPNAFATGRDPQHASIAVTTGLLATLNKVELEGVIAHELAHIKNYDIRVMTIVVVLVGLIVLISDIFLRMSLFRGGNRDNKQGAAVILIIALILALLSPLIAQLIKLAVSRTREYLADASGAMLTRHPEGLASALEKIASNRTPLQRANHATAHLFISNPFGKKQKNRGLAGLWSTHPPTESRIERLRKMGT